MTRVYGNEITQAAVTWYYTAEPSTKYSMKGGKWKTFIEYSTSSTATTYTLTFGYENPRVIATSITGGNISDDNWKDSGIFFGYPESNVSMGSKPNTSAKISITGKSPKITGGPTDGLYSLDKANEADGGYINYQISPISYTWNRTTSDQKITVTVSITNFSKTSTVTLNLTIPALASYNVNYNANGGSGAPAAQKKFYNTNLILSSTKPTRTGYTFKNWTTASNGTGTAYNPGATYTGNSALTLYANWLKNYTVSYNANGGSGAPAAQTYVQSSAAITLSSTKPTWKDHVFKNWNTSSNGSGTAYSPGGKYQTNADATLYAQWYNDGSAALGALVVKRVDDNGNDDDMGTKLGLSIPVTMTGPANVSTNLVISYKDSTATEYTAVGTYTVGTKPAGTSTQTINFNKKDFPITLLNDSQYDIRVVLNWTSYTSGSTSKNGIVTKTEFVLDFKDGGHAVGIGTAAPSSGLEIGYETTIDKTFAVKGNASTGGSHTVNGALNAKSTATITGALTTSSTAVFGGRTEAKGAIVSNGDIVASGGNVISINSNNITDSSTASRSEEKAHSFQVVGANGYRMNAWQTGQKPDGELYTGFLFRKRTTAYPGEDGQNYIWRFSVYNNGTMKWQVPGPGQFRTAISAPGMEKNGTAYWGFTSPDVSHDSWMRTTSTGLIPYKLSTSETTIESNSNLGTPGWHFGNVYASWNHAGINYKNFNTLLGRMTSLWSGTLSVGGSITVPNIQKYVLFAVRTNLTATTVICTPSPDNVNSGDGIVGNFTRLSGVGNYTTSDTTYTQSVNFSVSGTTVTLDNACSHQLRKNENGGIAGVVRQVTRISGIY